MGFNSNLKKNQVKHPVSLDLTNLISQCDQRTSPPSFAEIPQDAGFGSDSEVSEMLWLRFDAHAHGSL